MNKHCDFQIFYVLIFALFFSYFIGRLNDKYCSIVWILILCLLSVTPIIIIVSEYLNN